MTMKIIRPLLLCLMSLFFSCNFQRFDPIVSMQLESNLMDLISIELLQDHNPGLYSNIPPVYEGNDITFFIPPDLDSTAEDFILDFCIEGYSFVTLGSERIESGETPYLFGHDTYNSFTIYSANGDSREYRIRLVEEFHAFLLFQHPDDSAVTEKPHYNSSFPVYIQFNSPVESGSFSRDDLEIDPSMQISSDPVDMDGTGTLFKVEIDAPTALSGEYTLGLPAGRVANQSTGANPPLNDNDSVVDFIWDIDPPVYPSSGLPALTRDKIYVDQALLLVSIFEDNYTSSEELEYNIYYSSTEDQTPLLEPPVVDASNFSSFNKFTNDWISTDSNAIGFDKTLTRDRYYNFVVVVRDKAGNISVSNSHKAFLTSTIHVSSNRGDDSNADGTKSYPFATIQPALDFAWEHGQKTVKVEAVGVYNPGPTVDHSIRLYPDMKLLGGYDSTFSNIISKSILSGRLDGTNYSRHLISHNETISNPPNSGTILSNFTLTNGKSMNTTEGGGAIYSAYDLTISDCNFLQNSSQGKGGGAIHIVSGATLDISGCTFEMNISNSQFTSLQNYGGAILAENSTLIIKGSKIGESLGNEADSGGAIAVIDGTFTSEENDYVRNRAEFDNDLTQSNGGAIYLEGDQGSYSSTLDKFTGNISTGKGGALYIVDNDMIISNSQFSSNYCSTPGVMTGTESGGAIYILDGSPDIYNSTFYNNYNPGSGGAITLEGNSTSDLKIENSLFIRNHSKKGPAIYINNSITNGSITTYGTLELYQSIFAENYNTAEVADAVKYAGGSIYLEKGNITAGFILFYLNHDHYNNTPLIRDISMGEGKHFIIYNSEFIADDMSTNSYFINAPNGVFEKGWLHSSNIQPQNTSIFDYTKILDHYDTITGFVNHPNIDVTEYFINGTPDLTTPFDKYYNSDSPFYPKNQKPYLLDQNTYSELQLHNLYIPATDLAGNDRLSGGGYDLGPYEYQFP